MPDSYSILTTNVIEIREAVHEYTETQQLNLYASSSETLIYTTPWMGRIFKWLNQIWKWLGFQEQGSVSQTIAYLIQNVFHEVVCQAYQNRLIRLVQHIKILDGQADISTEQRTRQFLNYKNLFRREWPNISPEMDEKFTQIFHDTIQRPINGSVEITNRHCITKFQAVTRSFWKFFIKGRYCHILNRLVNWNEINYSILKNHTLYRAFRQEENRVRLEGILQQPIPLLSLAKIKSPDLMTITEKKELSDWIQGLNLHKNKISSKLFEKALKEILSLIKIQGREEITLNHLLVYLSQQQCELVELEDPKYMDWREGLNSGDKIACNEVEFTLGLPIGPIHDGDQNRIFTLKENANWVVQFGVNRFQTLVKAEKVKSEIDHFGVRPSQIIQEIAQDKCGHPISGIDRQGRCLIVEKLSDPISEHMWTSQNRQLLPQDERVASILANHLYCMYQWKAFSQSLSLSHLHFDFEGILKSSRLLKKGADDFNEQEKFCLEASKSNPFVLAYLVYVSKLHEHPLFRYYREAIEYVFKHGKTQLLTLRQPVGYQDKKYLERAEVLCQQAIQMQTSCFNQIQGELRRRGSYNYQQEDQLRKAVSDLLIDTYQNQPLAGILPLTIEKTVIEKIKLSGFQNLSLSQRQVDNQYYLAQHEEMMRKNRHIISLG